MDLFEELRRRGGITRTRTLRDAGVSEHTIRRAKAEGAVIKPRNGWVALPDADWFALAVVRRGLVISCVSLAERRGLWVPERHQRHVVASPHSSRFSVPEHAVVHWAQPVIPREPDAVEDDLATHWCSSRAASRWRPRWSSGNRR